MTCSPTLGWTVVLAPSLDEMEECPECGFDSLLSFPVKLLHADGVTDFGAAKRCCRCADMEAR